MTHVHAVEDELRDETAILLLRVSEERQGAVVEFHDDLASVARHQHFQGAQIESAELSRYGFDPAAVLFRHGRLFQHGRAEVGLPVARNRLAPIENDSFK